MMKVWENNLTDFGNLNVIFENWIRRLEFLKTVEGINVDSNGFESLNIQNF